MPFKDTLAYRLLARFESLHEQVEEYIRVVDKCPVPTFIATRDGLTIMFVNAAYKRLIGKGEDALHNFDWVENVIYEEDHDLAIDNWHSIINAPPGTTQIHHHRYVLPNGTCMPARTYSSQLRRHPVIVGYIIPTTEVGLKFLFDVTIGH